MRNLHASADAVLSRVENLAVAIAGTALFAAMVLVSADAILRHAFSWPLTFQIHLTQYYLMVIGIMLALSWGFRTGGAIQIRLLLDRLPGRTGIWLVRVALLGSAAYVLTLGLCAWGKFHTAFVNSDVVMGVIDWPVAWSWLWVPLGCGILACRLLLDGLAPTLRTIGAHDRLPS